MNLTPREKDKLLISMAAIVARRRLERGRQAEPPRGGGADHRISWWKARGTGAASPT